MNHAFRDNSVIGTCLKLAQSTFFDTLPANAEHKGPTAPPNVTLTQRAPNEGTWQRWINRLDNWFHRQRVKEREAYLAQARDVFDLEERIRRLERYPYY